MVSDISWMTSNRRSVEFRRGVDEFVGVARMELNSAGVTRCPCMRCLNVKFETPDNIRVHLFVHDIQRSYTTWYFHGESFTQSAVEILDKEEEEMADVMADILREDPSFDDPSSTTASFNELPVNGGGKYDDLFKDMETELYTGCKKSALNALVKLMHCKVPNKWSNHSFDMLLAILIELFPEGTKLPKSHYESKMKLHNLGLGYETIDVCKYNYALFWKENEKKKKYVRFVARVVGKRERETEKKVARKVLRYFPLIPRLKRLYSSRHSAEDMWWHYSKRPKEDGVLRHPTDAEELKQFDRRPPSFALEPENSRTTYPRGSA
ncbi:hypothetical protein CsatB_007071 [Cannabis sativa]|uniref:uncharacterized protein LOC133032146 n=1 Tax=Cannabis sativa TaxID=3483 RepID=UPI0029CAA9CD|nr:uncharacterized protein LOC133032146 [Cannabis sativa]